MVLKANMLNVVEKKDKIYKKHNSFHSFKGKSQNNAKNCHAYIIFRPFTEKIKPRKIHSLSPAKM